MATIGRAFAFYIKYWGQMEYMKEHGEEALAKAPRQHHWEETKKQIKAVRERANEQAALLIEECGEVMKDHFEKLGCAVYRETRESTAQMDWYVYYDQAKQGRGRKTWRTGMGVCIDCPPRKKTPSILLRLWTPTVAGAKELEGLLGECVCRGADLTGWGASCVFFAQVPIKLSGWDNWKRLERDGKRLVEETRKALEKINRKVVRTLLRL